MIQQDTEPAVDVSSFENIIERLPDVTKTFNAIVDTADKTIDADTKKLAELMPTAKRSAGGEPASRMWS